MKIPSMVSMELDAKEQAEMLAPSLPKYPYGLCISLCEDELEKLNLDKECYVGDMLHMHCLAEVTSVSMRDDSSSGPSCRIELQITHLSVPENEDDENRESEKGMTSRLYL